ncbi:MAG: TatD family hydrolase [Paludibacter sp.]
MLVDIHTHKQTESDNPSIRNLTFSEAENFFSTDRKGLFSVGIHPWFINEYSKETIENLIKWVKDERFFAIGECGLDKNVEIPLDQQILVFKEQIQLSERVCKPLIIHCVGCFNELFDLKKELNPVQTWIIHGFRGKPELAKQALKAGCALSFGEHYNSESVWVTPLDKLFAETDESSITIVEIYNQLATIKLCNIDELNAGYVLIKSYLKHIIT